MDFTVLERAPLAQQEADVPTLIATWQGAMLDLIGAAEAAGPEQWDAPSPCPGWSVGDLVAHATSLERFLLGRTDPPHEPDYSSLSHAEGGLSRVIEIPVDLRRTRTRDHVLAEARQTVADRLQMLIDGPQGADAEIMGPFGRPMPVPAMLRMRIFDTWYHEQDVRIAVDEPGHLGTPPAWVTAGTLVGALGQIWVKRAAAPTGCVAQLDVTGPGVRFSVQVAHAPEGRGNLIAPVTDPDTSVQLSWPDLVALGGGRIPASQGISRAVIAGDRVLGEALVTNLDVTP